MVRLAEGSGPSFPETKGKTLEEMDAVFGDQVIDHALETGHTHNVAGLDEKDGSVEKVETIPTMRRV